MTRSPFQDGLMLMSVLFFSFFFVFPVVATSLPLVVPFQFWTVRSRALPARSSARLWVFVLFFVFRVFSLCLAFIPSLELFLLYLVCRTFVFVLNFLNSPAASDLLLSPVQNQFPTFLIKENSVSSSIPHLPHQKEGWNFVPRLM